MKEINFWFYFPVGIALILCISALDVYAPIISSFIRGYCTGYAIGAFVIWLGEKL